MKLAVIPARGGSKRIPRKNIRPFAGKPMIAYAIEAAQASGLFEHIVVTTDDAEIADVARGFGAEVPFVRPPELSDDYATTVPVVDHAIRSCEALGWVADAICCIYPGVPLLEVADMIYGAELVEQLIDRYVFPVAAYSSPIQRALLRLPDGSTRPFAPEYAATRTQDLEPAYHDAGQFYWGKRDVWLAGLNIHQNSRTIVLPEWRVADIDTQDDWDRAETLYRTFRGREQA
ncbi:MAG: pseudaminic acid cytidylyltransferase [Oxalobacteraceae bacterium]|nr:MAG: pseudaminic acid cytidylyltransferase [Oxalobacteraceae bacterium]